MTYITDEEISALPDEPEEAFVALAQIIRRRYDEEYDQLNEHQSPLPLQRRYINVILLAAKHYGIVDLASWERPAPSNGVWQEYNAFMDNVDYCVSELRLRNIERAKSHSVALDAAAKLKLRHLLAQIREKVDELDVSVAKKDRLYSRINALQAEIDRDRTRYQVFAALLIEASDDAGEAAERLEPVVRLIERIGSAIGIAKRAEDARPKLSPPKEPKRIEPPKRKPPPFDKPLDDEIPF